MPGVAIVTDSTCYLPRPITDHFGIGLVSLYVTAGGVSQRETEMESYADFYRELADMRDLPTTSQPSIGDFIAVWEPLLAAGRDVVSIHLAGGISGTAEAARQAREVLREQGTAERIEVIDGETACGGLGCIVLAGARAAAEGGDLAAVAAHVREARRSLKLWFAIDTLEYLRRGGRVGAAQAWLGGALKIKPILSLEREITPVERVRTAGRAFDRLVEYMRERERDGSDGWVVQHSQAPEQAQRLVERGREIYGCEPIFVSEVGPVIGTYTGPGLLGVGGVPRSFVPTLPLPS
jgi:fatty acid kinase fatty acid binding subunit